MSKSLRVDVTNFHPHIDIRDNVALLGFARINVVAEEMLPGGEDFELTSYDVTAKILNGKPRVDFRRVPGRKEGSWFDTTHPGNAATREFLTDEIFADSRVKRAAKKALDQLVDDEQMERMVGAATGTDDEIPY